MRRDKIEIPLDLVEESKELNHIKLDFSSEEDIPIHNLGPDNPILQYGEVVMYEDEFGDRGYSRVNARYRVMENCFFVLLRSYIRVDGVLVRILDTRIYHEFGTKHILRDFSHRESTYSALRQKGFMFGSEWLLSPQQSDEVYGRLEIRAEFKDKITFD